ncbi:MAG: ATP-dependent DNA helicase RecG, partial [Pseudomonadota bacterium]
GPRYGKLFATLAGEHLVDLCWHLPAGIIDRRYAPTLAHARPGRIASMTVTVGEHHSPPNRRQPYRVFCHDDGGEIELVFFHARPDYLAKILPPGSQRLISGKVDIFSGRLQMTHPDHAVPLEEAEAVMVVEPTYPLTAGLTQKVVQKVVRAALKTAPALPEWLDPAHKEREKWPDWRDALKVAHHPESEDDLSPSTPARCRLAYDELLANQLALALIRQHQSRRQGRAQNGDGRLREKVLEALPFSLTDAQNRAVNEIATDMAADGRMLRLLQGDVGSGKTIVALMAMLIAVESGGQAALMAPTEILVQQHARTIEPLLAPLGMGMEVLTGRDKGVERREKLGRLERGESQIAVGTHALFQKDVGFHNLSLAVIDEQHRFGVHQRLELTAKGHGVDVLVMTATPIPRTLMLTAYGDMETSRLLEKPPGRQPVDTRVLPSERLADVVTAAGRSLDKGHKVFWVCPLVEESETLDLAAAEDRFNALAERFPGKVGLIHGRMKSRDKDAAMQSFVTGDVDLLVATTVIEVGVDVPLARVMVIEHAERFGLAQLHQLRGRIGRGRDPATCLLIYQGPLGKTARARLEMMRRSEDGFEIAEEDLRLRGAGELLGTRQSGFPEFRLADLAVHGELLATARDEAKLLLQRDGGLDSPRGKALQILLYLFERDAAVRLLSSG